MSLTGTFGATKATELASLFTAADARVNVTMNINGLVDPSDDAAVLSGESPTVGGFNI